MTSRIARVYLRKYSRPTVSPVVPALLLADIARKGLQRLGYDERYRQSDRASHLCDIMGVDNPLHLDGKPLALSRRLWTPRGSYWTLRTAQDRRRHRLRREVGLARSEEDRLYNRALVDRQLRGRLDSIGRRTDRIDEYARFTVG